MRARDTNKKLREGLRGASAAARVAYASGVYIANAYAALTRIELLLWKLAFVCFRLREHIETTKAVETQQLRRRHPRGLREPFASGQVVKPFRDQGEKTTPVTSPKACSALFSARTTPQPSQNLVEPCWNPGGTLVEPWWNPGGTLVEPWWNPRGTLPQGRPGPPRSLSGLRPQSFQLLEKTVSKPYFLSNTTCNCRLFRTLLK